MTDSSLNALMEDILDYELRMFVAVPNEGGPASCQQQPKMFRLMRWMEHSVLDEATLTSWREDLRRAEAAGRNLMTEKYARMEMRPEPNPLCDFITATESAFMAKAAERYPYAIARSSATDTAQMGKDSEHSSHNRASADDGAFARYLHAELETYSPETLRGYADVVRCAMADNRNLAVERFDNLWRRLGYASLEAREAELSAARAAERAAEQVKV